MKIKTSLLVFTLLLGGYISFFQLPSLTFSPSLAQSCTLVRPLNPDANSQPNETELDRYFRLAFNEETSGNFQAAINYYQKAANLAGCDCDRQHALAGKQSAEEAQQLLETEGMRSRPTQLFWGRLQELTENLPCIKKGEYHDEN